MKLRLDLNLEESQKVKDNFQNIEDTWRKHPIVSGDWQFIEKDLSTGTHRIYHKLGFKPRDVISLAQTGTGSVSFNYSDFTESFIELTVTTSSVAVRFLIGRVG